MLDMTEQLMSDDLWRRAWTQQESDADRISEWCFDVVRKLPFPRTAHACIFNCSDGPAALGIVHALSNQNPTIDVLLTDIHPYAIGAAKKYIETTFRTGFVRDSVRVYTQLFDTTQLLCNPPIKIQHFISYEPVAVDVELFEFAYDMLSPGTSITIIARSPMGPISYLGIAAKHKNAITHVESGMRTQSGSVMAIMMMK